MTNQSNIKSQQTIQETIEDWGLQYQSTMVCIAFIQLRTNYFWRKQSQVFCSPLGHMVPLEIKTEIV